MENHPTKPVSIGVKKITTHVLQEMKLKGEKISMLTAYDYSMA
ncbi:MAG: 3-methyl-2-oxobutanoate hydroxymethyltransferase, partial [Bacteroidota bacterium]